MYVSLLATVLSLGAPALKELPKKEPAIVGDWEVQALTLGGRAFDLKGVHIYYRFTSDGRWAQRHELREHDAFNGFSIGSKAGLRTIDLDGNQGEKHPVMTGIFEVDGDTLALCMANVRSARPTKFESPAGSDCILYVLKRVKEK
jgi:uncharacterized protein (TIGR03067 family)